MRSFGPRRLLLAATGVLCLFGNMAAAAKSSTSTAAATSSAAASDNTNTAALTDLPSLSTATSSSESSSSTSSASSASSGSSTASTTTGAGGVLTDAPTIAGVGIPTLVVPYTADAPFMQKSNMPEGTVFIVVGAVLAFLGLCVLAWRALVAWSIDRSVKRAAMASIMASDIKHPGGWNNSPYKPSGGFYSQPTGGSSTSLQDHGTVRRNGGFRNPVPSNASGLFFSPTASGTAATTNIPMTGLGQTGNRTSSLLPAGYYAAPSSQIAGGQSQTNIGGYSDTPSLQARRGSTQPVQLAPPRGRDNNTRYSRASSLSPGPAMLRPSGSASSLHAVTGHEDAYLPGSRAPSAYLEDLFEGHGNPAVPRSRGNEF